MTYKQNFGLVFSRGTFYDILNIHEKIIQKYKLIVESKPVCIIIFKNKNITQIN
jgi:hypothetical protein